MSNVIRSLIVKVGADTTDFSNKMNYMSKDLKGISKSLNSTGRDLSRAGATLTKSVTLPIVGIGAASGKAAIDFESAFAGVKKTVDASVEDLARLEQGIRDMSKEIPASAVEIAGVAEAAGQLGIEVPNIMDFTRVMIDLGEATNLSADEAATSLARFANITGMSQQEFNRLGSTIVDLGNNLATTESEIVEMGMRLAGAGSQIGLTDAQIMSFAGALSSVGIEAEAGGSAFSKVMIEMQLATETQSKKLEDFARVAGMTGAEFTEAFKTDAAGAMIEFIAGLSKAEEQGTSAIKVLDDMGIKEVRLRDALLRASGASEVFTDSLEIGTTAWNENNALAKEAEQRYETTASQMEIAKNKMIDVGITIGEKLAPHLIKLIDKVTEVVEWFGALDPATQEQILKMAALAAAIGPVLSIAGKLTSGFGSLFGAASKVTGIISKLSKPAVAGKAAAALSSVGTAGTAASGGIMAAVGAAAPWVAAAVGVVVAGKEIYDHLSEDLIPEFELFDDTISESTKEALGSFIKMSDGAVAQLEYLGLSGATVSEQLYTDFTTNTNAMADEVIARLEKQKEDGLRILTEQLSKQNELSEEEKQEALRIATEKYDDEIRKATEGKAKIEEILLKAKEANRGITADEKVEIEGILENLKENSISLMTESQEEQEKILETLKNNADRITAEMMSEVIKNSITQKDETIANANQQYEDVLAAAELLKRDGTAESIKLADNMIAEAERQKNETIAKAEETHEKVLAELKAQGGDLINQIDLDNGEIKSRWDELKEWFNNNPIVRFFKTIDDGSGAAAERNDRINPLGGNNSTISWNTKPTSKVIDSSVTVGTRWNADGAIFTRPTVLPTIAGWQGFGEAGPEVALPLSKLDGMLSERSQTVNHTGTITVKGVNNHNELMGIVDIVMDTLRREVRA